jgi:hypothetical protein
MTSLDGAARTIGLPGKDGVDGSQVEGLFHAGQLDALRGTVCPTSRRRRSCSCATAWSRAISTATATGTRQPGLLLRWRPTGGFGALLDGLDRRRLLLSD